MSLRSKRLTNALDPDAARFLDSTHEDALLLRDDILGTLAHVAVLEKGRVLAPDEATNVRAVLGELYELAPSFDLRPELEDVHMNVEAYVTDRLGDLGKKIHTGRSRNDQVALDLRLWARRSALELASEVHRLATALLGQAERSADALIPAHTHFQIAQPVRFDHYLGAHVARFERDLERIEDALERISVNPLGAAAVAGTGQPVDPALAASLLGLNAAFDNSLDATSDRDFAHELLFCHAVALNHVSALAEELIVFAHPAFGFLTLPDSHATGSSLMPQKKNPDVLEVARAKAATAIGALTASLATSKALPLAYNRDYQEQKRLLLETVSDGIETVHVVADLVNQLTFHPEAMARLAGQGHADATDLADYLVHLGVPFRTAHGQAAALVQLALAEGCNLSALTLERLRSVNPKIGKDVVQWLGPEASVERKTSHGGTSRASSRASLGRLLTRLEEHGKFLLHQAHFLRTIEERLLALPIVKNK